MDNEANIGVTLPARISIRSDGLAFWDEPVLTEPPTGGECHVINSLSWGVSL
jgi:hypothetical protein